MSELFEPTSWSKIRRASQGGGREQQDALNLLAEAYRPPLLMLAKRIGVPENDVEDEVQSVLSSVLSPGRLTAMDRAKGRFSHYLAATLKRRWLGLVRARHRQRRDVRITVSLSALPEELIAGGNGEWEREIDRHMGEQCLERVRALMVLEAADPVIAERQWTDLFRRDCSPGEARGPMSDACRQRLRMFRRDFREHFREAVAAGLTDPADLEGECIYLLGLALEGRGTTGNMGYGNMGYS